MRARKHLVMGNEAAPVLSWLEFPGGPDDASHVGVQRGNGSALARALRAGEQAPVELGDRQVRGGKQLLRGVADAAARDRAAGIFLGEGVQPGEVPRPLLRA